MHRADYVIKRIAFALMTIFVAITINFILFRALPGSAIADLTRVPHSTPALRISLSKEFGLDRSMWSQYVIYLRELIFHGNLGISFQNQQPVTTNLWADLRATLPMVIAGTVVAIVIGVVTGFLAAWRRNGITDVVSTNVAIVFYALPTQFLGMLLIFMFAGVLPISGRSNAVDNYFAQVSTGAYIADVAKHTILPALTLALTLYGEYTLIVRSAMLETLGEDYVLTARAKGLPQRRIVVSHALRNAMLPIATLTALSLGYIVAGAILIERVFSYHGIGEVVYDAVHFRDYPMLQGAFLILTISVVFFNLVADLIYFKLDPRITG